MNKKNNTSNKVNNWNPKNKNSIYIYYTYMYICSLLNPLKGNYSSIWFLFKYFRICDDGCTKKFIKIHETVLNLKTKIIESMQGMCAVTERDVHPFLSEGSSSGGCIIVSLIQRYCDYLTQTNQNSAQSLKFYRPAWDVNQFWLFAKRGICFISWVYYSIIKYGIFNESNIKRPFFVKDLMPLYVARECFFVFVWWSDIDWIQQSTVNSFVKTG